MEDVVIFIEDGWPPQTGRVLLGDASDVRHQKDRVGQEAEVLLAYDASQEVRIHDPVGYRFDLRELVFSPSRMTEMEEHGLPVVRVWVREEGRPHLEPRWKQQEGVRFTKEYHTPDEVPESFQRISIQWLFNNRDYRQTIHLQRDPEGWLIMGDVQSGSQYLPEPTYPPEGWRAEIILHGEHLMHWYNAQIRERDKLLKGERS